jgi:hypothetical protein
MKMSLGFNQQRISAEQAALFARECARPRVLVHEGINGNLYYYGNDEFRESVYWSSEQRPMTLDSVAERLGYLAVHSIRRAVSTYETEFRPSV